MFNWRAFLDQHRIPYVTEGPNTPRGSLGIKCPFCGEADPSEHMVLRPFGNYWSCWRDREHRGGNPAKLVQALLGCSFSQAYDITAGSTGPAITENLDDQIEEALQRRSVSKSDSPIDLYPEWPASFRPFTDGYAARPFLEYLSKRGFHKLTRKPEILTSRYDLHYCVTGSFKGRIIFPVIQAGKLISWTGRSIYQASTKIHRYKSLTTDRQKAREMGLDPAAAPLNNALLWQDSLDGGEILVIVEGPFDALRVRYLGEHDGIHATCLFTSMPTNSQVSLIRGLAPKYRRIIILLDSDARVKAERLRQQLSPIVEAAWLGEGDPGDIKDRGQLLKLLDGKIESYT